MHTRNGRSHRRWEFMLLPDERPADFDDPARVWELLSPWLGPDDAELTRYAVYEFRALLAQTMRDGRVFLAGDSAHLMPPFMGQGLCSGVRDAANLAWKLDLALRGRPATTSSTPTPRNDGRTRVDRPPFDGDGARVLRARRGGRRRAGRDAARHGGAAAGRPSRHRRRAAPPAAPTARRDARRPGDVAGPAGEGRFDDVVGRGFVVIAKEAIPVASWTTTSSRFSSGSARAS